VGYSYSVGRTIAENEGIYCQLFLLCDEPSIRFLKDRRPFGAATITLVRDRVNNILDPSEGSFATLTLLHASRLTGSDTTYEFNRGEFEMARYYPLGRRTVFAWRIRGGTILPRNINLAGQQVGYVPPDQRFYGGGPNSVRGYGRNELGPRVYVVSDTGTNNIDRDASDRAGATVYRTVRTTPTGGNTATVLNAELRLPSPIFASRMRLGVFVDAGQVWERGEELVSIRGMRVTPGAGVRFATPLGPVRIDAAYNGYPAERGPLLYQDTTTQQITRILDQYPPLNARKTFWQKIVLQFAVGQAF
jgi:outer membrane protein insertion porin family